MTIESKENEAAHTRPVIDLTGPDGNVFFVMGRAQEFYRQLGRDDFDKLQADMMSGDYEHAIAAFERELGDYVTLLR